MHWPTSWERVSPIAHLRSRIPVSTPSCSCTVFLNFEPSIDALHVAGRAHQALVTHVERCQAIGLFSGANANDAAQVIWSACHGYVSLELIDINFSAKRDETYVFMLKETLRDGFR